MGGDPMGERGTDMDDGPTATIPVGVACGYWTGFGAVSVGADGVIFRPGPATRMATALPAAVPIDGDVERVHIRLGRGGETMMLRSRSCRTVVVAVARRPRGQELLEALRAHGVPVIERTTWLVPLSRAPEGPKVISPGFAAFVAVVLVACAALVSVIAALSGGIVVLAGFAGLVFTERRRLVARTAGLRVAARR